METPVEHRFNLRVYARLQGPVKQLVQMQTLGFGQAVPQRLEFTPFFLGDEGFPPDHGWNQHGENRPRLPALMCQIYLDERAQVTHHHLVANT